MTNWISNKVAHNFDLRWVYEYNDGTPRRAGQWSIFSKNPVDMAAYQKTTNIARCLIETRNIRSMEEKVACHIQGQDFCLFQWEGLGVAPSTAMGNGSEIKLATGLIGLSIVSRDHIFTVLRDSLRVYMRDRTEQEKTINYATYG